MRITDFWEAVRTLCKVGSGTIETTGGKFYGTLDTYECAGDSERDCGCMYIRSSPFNKLVWEDEFIALEVPDEA